MKKTIPTKKTKASAKPSTIAAYIAAAPKESHAKLNEMLQILRKAAPKAEESLKWSMPSFSHKRILFIFGAFKKHIGFYPTPSAMRKFEKEIAASPLKLKSAKGSIQFPYDAPLPKTLISKMAKFRVEESIQEDGKWKPQN